MTADPAVFERDIAAVEGFEVNLGTVVDVTLPDGNSIVRALRRGQNASLGMELAGYSDKRQDEISVRLSQFDGLTVMLPEARQAITILGKSWLIESIDSPDNVLSIWKLVQNW